MLQKSAFLPPPTSLAIWTPLLSHLRTQHPTFPALLISRIISRLLADTSTPLDADTNINSDLPQEDASYDLCLASWAMWLVDAGDQQDADGSASRRDEAFVTLANGLGPRVNKSDRSKSACANVSSSPRSARSLFKAVCANDPCLAEISGGIVDGTQTPPADEWNDSALAVMDERLKIVLSMRTERTPDTDSPPRLVEMDVDMDASQGRFNGLTTLPSGWRILGPGSRWKPCPIGVYIGDTL
ncbi:hypothetical protein EW146_g7287 [Bondarzewia mesenterica]|uniref:Uncharacterized protein n=1 Tax=Bondarzewia mesenterica TaxID=1095465 RepID=A0A4S4LRV0_9AGAM|nr:hypothetical protein EW146_g7287 [Bondarzewia mesenterica]